MVSPAGPKMANGLLADVGRAGTAIPTGFTILGSIVAGEGSRSTSG